MAEEYRRLAREVEGQPVMDEMRSMMHKLKLTVNEEKTHICRIPDETFDFLGYTFGRCYSPKTGYRFIGQRPSQKKVQAICKQISQLMSPFPKNQELANPKFYAFYIL